MCWRVEFLEQSSIHHSLPLSSFNLSSPVSLYEVKTVIVCVCVCRRYEVAKLLGNHGAAVNLRGKSGSTAFDIANMLGELLNLSGLHQNLVLCLVGDIEMIRIVANISVERIRKTSAPPPSTTPKSDLPSLQVSTTPPNNSSATPTTSTPTPESPATPGGAPVQKKHSVPLGPPRLKSLTPTSNKMPLDTSELIRKLKMAYADPVTPPAIPSTVSFLLTTNLLCGGVCDTRRNATQYVESERKSVVLKLPLACINRKQFAQPL